MRCNFISYLFPPASYLRVKKRWVEKIDQPREIRDLFILFINISPEPRTVLGT